MRGGLVSSEPGAGLLAHADPHTLNPRHLITAWILLLLFSCLPTCSMDIELWSFKQ